MSTVSRAYDRKAARYIYTYDRSLNSAAKHGSSTQERMSSGKDWTLGSKKSSKIDSGIVLTKIVEKISKLPNLILAEPSPSIDFAMRQRCCTKHERFNINVLGSFYCKCCY